MLKSEQMNFLRLVATEVNDESIGVLLVANYQLGRRRILFCPNCGRRMRLGVGGTGIVEVICRSRECEQNPHETKIIFRQHAGRERKKEDAG